MTDQNLNLASTADLTDAAGGFVDPLSVGWEPERQPFKPDYTPLSGVRILRHRLYANEGGVASATFTGRLDADAIWVEGGTSGRMSVYAEVTRGDGTEQTTLRVALVPTGKRVPEDARRIGSKRGMHAYLLSATVAPKPEPVAADDADQIAANTDPAGFANSEV